MRVSTAGVCLPRSKGFLNVEAVHCFTENDLSGGSWIPVTRRLFLRRQRYASLGEEDTEKDVLCRASVEVT
jgi:hypothetical protein